MPHSPEECLQVFWKLSSSSIARVHGDEQAHCRSQPDLSTLKVESDEIKMTISPDFA